MLFATRTGRIATLLFSGGMLLVTLGCGIFDTRDPEPPSDTEEIPFQNPIEPRIVLENTKATLERFSSGNYINALLEDFAFSPDPVDAADWDGRAWGKQQEQTATDAILRAARGGNGTGTLVLTWDVPEQTRDAGTGPLGEPQEYYENLGYQIVFTQGTATVTYAGKANLYFRQGSTGLWAIYNWEDLQEDDTHPTWGRLRITNGPVFS